MKMIRYKSYTQSNNQPEHRSEYPFLHHTTEEDIKLNMILRSSTLKEKNPIFNFSSGCYKIVLEIEEF